MEYKYASKYSHLSAEERERIRREQHERWKANLSEERKREIRERLQEHNKHRDASGRCDICEKDYIDIYQHRRSQKHKRNEEKKQEEMKKKEGVIKDDTMKKDEVDEVKKKEEKREKDDKKKKEMREKGVDKIKKMK